MRKVALVVGLLLLGGGALAQTLPERASLRSSGQPRGPGVPFGASKSFPRIRPRKRCALCRGKPKSFWRPSIGQNSGAEEIGVAVRALELALIALSTGSATVTEVLNRLSQAVAEGVLGPLASETKALSGLPGLASSPAQASCALEPRALE